MFTSRAEYRLIMREDNADMRLTEKGNSLGLIQKDLWETYGYKKQKSTEILQKLKDKKIIPNSEQAAEIKKKTGEEITSTKTHYELLKRPAIKYKTLPGHEVGISNNIIDEIESKIKYEGYIARQKKEILKLQKNENTPIPAATDFNNVIGLSNEVKQKLTEAQPESLARASRLPGVTPAAISLLMVHLKKLRRAG